MAEKYSEWYNQPFVPPLISLIGTLGGGLMSGFGASKSEEEQARLKEEELRLQKELKLKELAQQQGQFDVSTALGRDQFNRTANMKGLDYLTGQVANAQQMATRRTLRNKIYNAVTAGV